MNRILESITKIENHIATLSPEKKEKLDTLTMMDKDTELFAMQNIQAKATASGRLTLDEGTTLYAILGEDYPTVEKFNRQSVANRYVAIKTITELK